jgi:hydrogenase-4 component B
MVLSMVPLAICCVVIGVLPALLARPLENVIGAWSGYPLTHGSLGALSPLTVLTPLTGLLAVLMSIAFLFVRRSSGLRRAAMTWDCGYAQPSSRMQYTASSFAQTLVRLLRSILRPSSHEEKIALPFPTPVEFHSHVDDMVLDRVLIPAWRRFRGQVGRLRFIQQGSVQGYLFYILLILLILLLAGVPVVRWFRSPFVG